MYTWNTDAHRRHLAEQRSRLLDFYQPHVVDPGGGYFWLGDTGQPMPEKGKELWIAARMVHCFSLASLLGREGADDVARHGVRYLTTGPGRDGRHGGWFNAIHPGGRDASKQLYGLAHVILAGSSALTAGIDGARPLLDEAIALVDEHFWDEEHGAGIDAMDRAFRVADPYRGLNANMHLTEAYLAAHEALGGSRLLDRAVRLAERFARDQVESGPEGYRLVEHFDEAWRPMPGHNRDEPAHPFRPYGSTPGHWLEWAKLCIQIRALRPDVEWLLPTAERLFEGAVADAWADNGGFYYTLDWDGSPVISNRFFWPVTEAIGAAHLLRLATGEQVHADWYERLWRFADAHLMDHERGSWHSELDDDLRPTTRTWTGKPDLYHVLQATLYAELPLDRGLAAHLVDRAT